MKQLFFIISFLFVAFCSQAQFRLAVNGVPSWTNLGGGLYSATVTFHADLTGNSYAVAGIVDTMRLFTSRGQVFEVDSVWGKTFSQATLRVTYVSGVNSAPVGQGMVYAPNANGFVPDLPFGSTGATAQFNQMPVTYNASLSVTNEPAGSNTEIQYNNSAAFGASPFLTFNADTSLTIGNVKVWNGTKSVSSNVGVGANTLTANTTGTSNIAVGQNSLSSNTTGSSNTAIGRNSLVNNTTGSYNTANGVNALYYNTVGNNNTANGVQALYFNTGGNHNAANGVQALFNNTTGNNNTAHGKDALYSNTTGNNNTAHGKDALYYNTVGNNNTANGFSALYSNTTGFENTANGVWALGSNTTGIHNTATGYVALYSNTTGSNNTANGYQALYSNKANSRSTAIGYSAMLYADGRTTGRETYNTALGYEALRGSTTAINNTGRYNTAIGDQALYSNTSGDNNTANGFQALLNNTTGSNNIAIGDNSGRYIADGISANAITNNSVYLGSSTKALANNQTNQIVIGHGATGLGDSTAVLGAAMKKVRLGDNLTFKTDQSIGSGQDNYVLTYDHAVGTVSLEAAPTAVDNSVTNEGALSVGAAGANTSQIITNTAGDGGVILKGGTGITLSESVDTITITSTATGISGLTTNYITKATSASTIGNGQLFDNGTVIGFNNATPKSWTTTGGLFEFGGANGAGCYIGTIGATTQIGNNSYYDGAWKYLANGLATNLFFDKNKAANSLAVLRVAGTGTANSAITWTNSIVVDSAGRVGILKVPINNFELDVNGDFAYSGKAMMPSGSSVAANQSMYFSASTDVGFYNNDSHLTVVNNQTGKAAMRIANLSSSGFSGIEYLDSGLTTKVFTGFNNSNGQEFRFNNIATGGYIDFMTNSVSKMRVANDGKIGIGTTSPDRLFHPEASDAVTNAVTYAQRNSHITSGTATTGFGVGTEQELEDAAGNNEVAATQEVTWSDATNASEDATYLIKQMKAGTLDTTLLITSTGNVAVGGNNPTPARTLHVAGEARITDLTTDTPTRIVGADADGDLGAITVGSGLNLSGGTLTATGGVAEDSLVVGHVPYVSAANTIQTDPAGDADAMAYDNALNILTVKRIKLKGGSGTTTELLGRNTSDYNVNGISVGANLTLSSNILSVKDTVYINLIAAKPGVAVTQTAGHDYYDATFLVPNYLDGFNLARVDYAMTNSTATTGSWTVGIRLMSTTNTSVTSNGCAATFNAGDVRASSSGGLTVSKNQWLYIETNTAIAGTLDGTNEGLLATLMFVK